MTERTFKADLSFPPELIDTIADRVIEKLLPYLQIQHDELLTVEEVSTLMKTTRSRIYQKVNDEKHGFGQGFPYHKDGRRLLLRRCEIMEWLDHNTL